MLTPRFTLSQDSSHVVVYIEAPYVKFSSAEICIIDKEFSFYCKPYYLKLYFSEEIEEDDTTDATYDVDLGQFTIKILKSNKGEHFTDLDMLTKLMINNSNQKTVKASTLIEVLKSDPNENYNEEEIDWSLEQVVVEPESPLADCAYGFNLGASGIFSKRPDECSELIDIQNPDETPLSKRNFLQKEHEDQNFNVAHYLSDLEDDDEIRDLVMYQTLAQSTYLSGLEEHGNAVKHAALYTKEEMELILQLPKKEYILEKFQTSAALVGLIDILYACLYDTRTTKDDPSVESAWTIRKLSSTLSWLTSTSDLRSAIISSLRRSLCFPLYRHWILSLQVLDDVRMVLAMGKPQVLKTFLRVRSIFNNTESYHIHNDLYITDYCVWLQSLSDKCLNTLISDIDKLHLSKQEIGLNICSIENSQLYLSSESGSDLEESSDTSGELNSSSTEGIDSSLDSDDSADDIEGSSHSMESSIQSKSSYNDTEELSAVTDGLNLQLSHLSVSTNTVDEKSPLIEVLTSNTS